MSVCMCNINVCTPKGHVPLVGIIDVCEPLGVGAGNHSALNC